MVWYGMVEVSPGCAPFILYGTNLPIHRPKPPPSLKRGFMLRSDEMAVELQPPRPDDEHPAAEPGGDRQQRAHGPGRAECQHRARATPSVPNVRTLDPSFCSQRMMYS